MHIAEFKQRLAALHVEEYPSVFIPGKDYISDAINYEEVDLELKIHICKLILCRSFYGTYTAWHKDVEWFINNFFAEFETDLIKPALTETIREASKMIMSEDVFKKGVMGTMFMFGILEYYAKYKLGFRPFDYDFFDKNKNAYIKQLNPADQQRDLGINAAFNYLKKQAFPVSLFLQEIDAYTKKRLRKAGVKQDRWIKYDIADRLSIARNPMLHGEVHSFYEKGPYLLMLFTLFHLSELMERN
jgi:hypothetical protein